MDVVTGTVAAPLQGECARCLDPITDELVVDVCELFAFQDSTTVETTTEDEVHRVDGDYIDIEPVVRDAVVLGLPWTPLCRPDCAGLCSVCGQKIDELIKQNWINNKVNPSERCSDYEFIRRASLDIVGRIATESEISDFLKQPESMRRSWLIDQLLMSPEYGENFANIWTVMLLTRSGSQKMYQTELREWLTEQLNGLKDESEEKQPEAKPAKAGKILVPDDVQRQIIDLASRPGGTNPWELFETVSPKSPRPWGKMVEKIAEDFGYSLTVGLTRYGKKACDSYTLRPAMAQAA